ncbi:MAG TPA: hypothetical protein VNJ51_08260 [Candidatus Dormibacteraeota bacterium]|nr:hypothetical protein [Candidatus Dormibacteraeota bacterium]
MKRAFSAAVLALGLAATSTTAFAAPAPHYGSVKMTWNVAVSASLQLATQFGAAAFTQGIAAPNLLPSAAGVCGTGVTGAPTSESTLNLSFGTLNPSLTAPVGCLYANAIEAAVQTNDAGGFAVYQYLDAAPTTGTGFCAFPDGGASFPLTPAAAAAANSAQSGNPAAGTFTAGALSACGAGGAVIPTGTGGTLTNAGGGPGSTDGGPGAGIVTSGFEYYTEAGTNGLKWASQATAPAGTVYSAEDVQLNLDKGAASTGASSAIMTIVLVPA